VMANGLAFDIGAGFRISRSDDSTML
jgi:hypothetical protein